MYRVQEEERDSMRHDSTIYSPTSDYSAPSYLWQSSRSDTGREGDLMTAGSGPIASWAVCVLRGRWLDADGHCEGWDGVLGLAHGLY